MADGDAVISIRDRLLKERHALLDLSTRNRLLNTPLRTRHNRAIEIVDEKSSEVFRILKDGKSMTFLPGVELNDAQRAGLDPDDIETGGIPQPEDDPLDERGVARRHTDLRLQTRLTSEGLQKRLFDVWYDARIIEDEQGVNILFLALGLLRWFDKESSEIPRHAPLILFPVALERSSAADKFKLKTRSEPPSPNLTLQAKMRAEFDLVIEDFADEDDIDLTAYCGKVAQTISKQQRWEVLPDAMVLGFFSFAKFLMYRDLDPENWPDSVAIDGHALISGLLRDGFPESEPLVADGCAIDDLIPPLELNHVVDADSSQTVVIAEASRGRTMVVKGPPGTGKSQTITNIIAAAAARGRKVLFVAEKMAALDVVHRRLRQVGLGPLALELHSNKVNKRTVLEELRRTRDATVRPPRGDMSVIQRLSDAVGVLNAFAERLHTQLEPCGLTPHAIIGRLVKLPQTDAAAGYRLEGADRWTRLQFEDIRRLVIEIAERLAAMGPIPMHPWRGVRRNAIDPTERDNIGLLAASIGARLQETIEASRIAVDMLGAPAARTLADIDRLGAWLKAAKELPENFDRSALNHPAWDSEAGKLKSLVEAGARRVITHDDVSGLINEAGWSAGFDEIRRVIVAKGGNLFRFLDSQYRAQIALLRSYLNVALPRSTVERVAIIDRIVAAQKSQKSYDEKMPVGLAFGRNWDGEASDWKFLASIIDWRNAHEMPALFYSSLAQCEDYNSLLNASIQFENAAEAFYSDLHKLIETIDLDMQRALGAAQIGLVRISDLQASLVSWQTNLEQITRFIAFAARGREFERNGGADFVTAIHDGFLDGQNLVAAFDRAYADNLRNMLFTSWPELRAFDGDSQDRAVAFFRQMDKARIELAKENIATFHADNRPKGGAGIGALGVLNAELAKKRAHLPIRILLDRAGPAVQQLKPVFLMSPLSVAQFLKPGGLQFDLLVMDEASQIEPVDALGSIARVRQIVVVGDERQLPPTAFFKKLSGEDERDDEDGSVPLQAKDAESILDLCLAKGVPSRMLSWHYRSKHQSLIAVSNREFYENKLFIVPSPYDAVAGMGLKFHLLANAPYDRGGTRTNSEEARIVAEAVMRHASEHPEQSLGVGTFSVAQRQTVLKELELLRRANPAPESFFSSNALEPFFVKNLENIQGDERDVIFISVGYGKTEQGYLAHAFGPLSGEGGERRLNVLISRAKMRCEVYCNFRGADIDLERTRAKGVAALKLFLTFAETGNFGLGEATGADHDSEFEAQVCHRLQSLGYEVRAQIGASGFRVDLAIGDSEKPGRFVLGIECDGAQYHSSRSARDRDRLRQQVLEAHGWVIHRIWSADWYLRPKEELKKVEAAIAAAKAIWRARDEEGYRAPQAVPISFGTETPDDPETVTVVVGSTGPVATVQASAKYREASFSVDSSVEPHQAALSDLIAYVVKIVEIEGPVHLDEITARIRTLWGLHRAGTRIRTAVLRAVEAAARGGMIEGGPFYRTPQQSVVVRDRSHSSASLRKPEMLPPEEIDAAILKSVDDNFGAARDELAQDISRRFGFAATSTQIRAVIEARVDFLLSGKGLILKGELLTRPG
jgi:very-short-patch-repair endonuclease